MAAGAVAARPVGAPGATAGADGTAGTAGADGMAGATVARGAFATIPAGKDPLGVAGAIRKVRGPSMTLADLGAAALGIATELPEAGTVTLGTAARGVLKVALGRGAVAITPPRDGLAGTDGMAGAATEGRGVLKEKLLRGATGATLMRGGAAGKLGRAIGAEKLGRGAPIEPVHGRTLGAIGGGAGIRGTPPMACEPPPWPRTIPPGRPWLNPRLTKDIRNKRVKKYLNRGFFIRHLSKVRNMNFR